LIAKRQPKPPPPSAKKRRGRHGGSDGRESRLWRPMKHKPGLVAVKHAQNLAAERTARTEQQGRAFVALAHVVADAGGGGWPEQMTRDLRACRTPQERNAWEQKWGGYLSGQAQRDKRGAPERPTRGRAADGGCQPS